MVPGGMEATHSSWHGKEEEDAEKRWWEAHRTSGIHLGEGTGMQDRGKIWAMGWERGAQGPP